MTTEPVVRKFDAWLAERDLTRHKFALAHGIDPSTLSKLLAGKQGASLKLAVKLEDATGGAFPARVWQWGEESP